MEECKPVLNTGLRGLVIANTRICDVDGAKGRLIYRGYLVQDLAQNAAFEEVAYLLLYEKLPAPDELREFKSHLETRRQLPPEVIAALKTRPKTALPMDILQAAVSLLAHHDRDVTDASLEATQRMAIKLIASFPTVVAAWHRIRNDLEPVDPSPELDHGANFLYMLSGKKPIEDVARFLTRRWSCMPSTHLTPPPLPPGKWLPPGRTFMRRLPRRWGLYPVSCTGAPTCGSWKCC